MAIYSNPIPPQPLSIDAWVEQATGPVNVRLPSSPLVFRGTSNTLAIPLDERLGTKPANDLKAAAQDDGPSDAYRARRESLRRDSLKRREALLKGKEGSRRRQRWENDRLLSNPWAQPPLPSDWEVHPTYPKRAVPYYLAPLWDANEVARQDAEKRIHEASQRRAEKKDEKQGKVPKELKEKMKKAKAAKGLLQALEEQIRNFLESWEEKKIKRDLEMPSEVDSEDEEIVFVGRNGHMNDMPLHDKNDIEYDHLVLDSMADDHAASFGRWLVHSIASYYGLRTWSITVGDPARREAYVGIKQTTTKGRPVAPIIELPRPLWGLV